MQPAAWSSRAFFLFFCSFQGTLFLFCVGIMYHAFCFWGIQSLCVRVKGGDLVPSLCAWVTHGMYAVYLVPLYVKYVVPSVREGESSTPCRRQYWFMSSVLNGDRPSS